jgi:hypothetical protein
LYLQHSFLHTIALDEPVAREVVNERLIARAGAAPRHADSSMRKERTACEAGEFGEERQRGQGAQDENKEELCIWW